MEVSDKLGVWITAAQKLRRIDPALPPEWAPYTPFARACDPVPGLLKAGGQYGDEQVVAMLLSTCFDGLAAR